MLLSGDRAALVGDGIFALVLVVLLVYVLFSNFSDTAVSKRAAAMNCFGKITKQTGRHNFLPKFDPPFIGRDKNVSDLISTILHSDVPVVHITGAPAIGKSHLAVHVAWELIDYGVDVKYVDLSERKLSDDYNPTAEKPSEHAAEDVATGESSNSMEVALRKDFELKFLWYSLKKQGNVIESTSDMVTWARSITSPTVLILDNCDDALQGRRKKAFLNVIIDLKRAHCVKIVSTSIVNITTLGVRNYPLNPLDMDSAVDLLQQESTECGEFEEVEKAKKVAILVGRNPYGLRLAAKVGCNALPIDDLIQELSVNAIAPLDNVTDTADEEKLEYIIELAITYLHEDTKLCGRNISLFPGSFSKEASLTILGRNGVKRAEECLKTLYQNSLLQLYYLDGVARFKYHMLIKHFFKNKNIKHEEKHKFYISYVKYFTFSILATLNECRSVITDSKDCQNWFRREDLNTRHTNTQIANYDFYLPEAINICIAWASILTHPTFWRVYGTRELISFTEYAVKMIYFLRDMQGVRCEVQDSGITTALSRTFDLLLKQLIQLNIYYYNSKMYNFMFDSTFNINADEESMTLRRHRFFNDIHVTSGNCEFHQKCFNVYQTDFFDLCPTACSIWCCNASKSAQVVLLFLCKYGCDPKCRYYITDLCLLALMIALLIPHIKQSLRNHANNHANSLGENFITVAVALSLSTMPARFISWLIQMTLLPLSEAVMNIIGVTYSQYTFGALLGPIAFSTSAATSLKFGGFTPFFYFIASSVLLYFYSDYIYLCLFSRIAIIVCVCRIVHVRSFLKQKYNVICIVLVVFGYWCNIATTCLYYIYKSILHI